MARVMLVFGTRPEAIKMAPMVPALRAVGLEPVVVVTGQHREMLDQVLSLFSLKPDVDLNLGRPRQTLAHITSSAVAAVNDAVRQVQPAAVVVQGDTSTTFAAALAAFYEQVPVAHVEAGLRTRKKYSPFPEEVNRCLTTRVAELHLAPTSSNRKNLLAEGIDSQAVAVTGNTVIDALLDVSQRKLSYSDEELERLAAGGRRIVLVTTHRRESWGDQMRDAMRAVRKLAAEFMDCEFVLPLHKNPLVRDVVVPELAAAENVLLTEPLAYGEFARLLSESSLVLTDSGGVQEEAPGLGKPVLVLREDTERPEAVDAGTVKLVGTDSARIFAEASRLLEDKDAYADMSNAVNPYGDGLAARRSAAAIAHMLGQGERLPDFGL